MFKRHAGLDVMYYQGTGANRELAHNLSKAPEMIWVKRLNSARTWGVYHKGLNAGSNPEQYAIYLDTTQAAGGSTQWNETAPTATHFSLGTSSTSNGLNDNYMAILFASVDGISKVGYYTGNGSNTERTITLGFQPRFIIIKHIDGAQNWEVLDTTRGWGSGGDARIWLDGSWAEDSANDIGAPTSNGFTLTTDMSHYNSNFSTYIYYAHA